MSEHEDKKNDKEKKEKDKNEKDRSRKIKQVYLSEDGSSETSVTSKVIEEDEQTPSSEDRADTGAGVPDRAHRMRVLAIAIAMIFSIFVSMAVGVGLALFDEHRTLAELNSVLFGHYVSAATHGDDAPSEEAMQDVSDASSGESSGVVSDAASGEASGAVSDAASGTVSHTSSDEADEPEERSQDEDGDDNGGREEYGMTMAGIEGYNSLEKAGANDEIAGRDEEDEPLTMKDPMEDYPLDFTTVDESYFTDALFIGDSRLQGFGFWSGLPATYYCATGFQLYKYDTTKVVQTENGKVPIFDAMPYDAFTKIYIKVGLNELGYGTEDNFEKKYAELIEKLREYEPRAVIYVHAILPVTEAKSETDKAHNNPNIAVRNAGLEKFAKTQKAYFLDAGPAVSDAAGFLRPEMTTDGIHLKPEYMKIWREYLCEHAIVIE